jgi:hypothetical protein
VDFWGTGWPIISDWPPVCGLLGQRQVGHTWPAPDTVRDKKMALYILVLFFSTLRAFALLKI